MILGQISLEGAGGGSSVTLNKGSGDEDTPNHHPSPSTALVKRPETSGSSDNFPEPFEEQIKRCQNESSVLFLLSKRLRAYQELRVGDPNLYSSLIDAAQYIQILCENNKESQDRLRMSGVLGTLVDSFIALFETHLEDRVSPLSYGPLMRCWCQISSALWHSVDSPTNAKNQEVVLGKLLCKNDFKIIDFVLKSTHSIEKQTEAYVIPIIQLFKGLIDDNPKNLEMLSSRKQFVLYLIESFRLRVQLRELDALMWKSVDLMAWLLSLILQYENSTSTKQENSESQNTEKMDIDKKLCSLIAPCCTFLDTNENDERPQSVGTLLFLASVFSRNIESVHRFNNCRGNDLIVKIQSVDHPEPVKGAMRALLAILKFQNKLLRKEGTRRNDGDTMEGQSSINSNTGCLLPYGYLSQSGPTGPDFSRNSTAVNSSPSPTPSSPPVQVVPNASWVTVDNDKDGMCKAWVDYATTVTHGNMKYYAPSSTGSFYHPSPPPPSIAPSESGVSSSISKYRQPSVLGNPVRVNSPFCPEKRSLIQPPPKRRKLVPAASTCGTHRSERRPRNYGNDDQSSLVSINIPKHSRQNHQKTLVNKDKETANELSRLDVAKILSDLRPCKVMETNEHLVVFCTPGSQANGSATANLQGIESNQRTSYQQSTPRNSTKPPLKCSSKSSTTSSTGLFGTVFNWLFK